MKYNPPADSLANGLFFLSSTTENLFRFCTKNRFFNILYYFFDVKRLYFPAVSVKLLYHSYKGGG